MPIGDGEGDRGGRPVTTADLATLPGLDRKGLDAFRALASEVHDDEDWREGRNLARTEEVFHPEARAVSTALRSPADDELARVADIYRANVDNAPLEAVKAELGVSRRTASRRVQAPVTAASCRPPLRAAEGLTNGEHQEAR